MSNHDLVRPAFEFRHRLVRAREIAGLDQASVAEAIDVSRATVSNYETGATRPTRLQARAWALACGVDPEWLIDGEDLTRRRATAGVGQVRRIWLPDLDSNQEPAGQSPAARLRRLAPVVRLRPTA